MTDPQAQTLVRLITESIQVKQEHLSHIVDMICGFRIMYKLHFNHAHMLANIVFFLYGLLKKDAFKNARLNVHVLYHNISIKRDPSVVAANNSNSNFS